MDDIVIIFVICGLYTLAILCSSLAYKQYQKYVDRRRICRMVQLETDWKKYQEGLSRYYASRGMGAKQIVNLTQSTRWIEEYNKTKEQK